MPHLILIKVIPELYETVTQIIYYIIPSNVR